MLENTPTHLDQIIKTTNVNFIAYMRRVSDSNQPVKILTDFTCWRRKNIITAKLSKQINKLSANGYEEK